MTNPFMRVAVAGVALMLAAEVYLLLSGNRFLVREDKTTPGTRFMLEGYGDLGAMIDRKLVCTYFTGRGLLRRAYHYSPSNILGRDSCPVWLNSTD